MNIEFSLPDTCEIHKRSCKCDVKKKNVLIDESYIYQNHVSNYGLTISSTPIRKPSGKGKRVVMIGAISEEGWIGYRQTRNTGLKFREDEAIYQNGSVKFWIGNVGSDYHRNFTAELQ